MVKIAFIVATGLLGACMAYPVAHHNQEDGEREVHFRQAGPLAAVFGSIGTALVPVFGAILGPILTNLASGIASAFNNGLNPAASSTNKSDDALNAQGLVVRIPPDSPLYLLAHPHLNEEGLPSVGPQTPAQNLKPVLISGKARPSQPAPVHPEDKETDETETHEPNVRINEVIPVAAALTKRHQQRLRTETEFA